MRYILPAISMLLFAYSHAVAGNVDVVTLADKAYVSENKIYLRDIGVIQGPNREYLSSIYLMKLPSRFTGVSLSSEYVAQKIRESYPEWQVTVEGPSSVYVREKLVRVSQEELESIFRDAVMASSPWKEKGKIIIKDVKTSPNVSVPERVKDHIQANFSPQEDFLGLTSANITFGQEALSSVCHVSAKIQVLAEVPVAKARIPRGTVISDTALDVRPMDISAYPAALVDKEECLGMRTKTMLQEGKPILRTNIEKPPLINRGDFVFIEARSKMVIIQDKGIALKDGYFHDRIPVRNAASGKQVYGTVIAPLQVEVIF